MTTQQQRQVDSIKEAMGTLTAPIRPLIESSGYPEDFLVAMAVVSALNSFGIRAELFAGSASWHVMDYELQGEAMLAGNKVAPNFGYDFDIVESFPAMVRYEYPDTLHAWAVTIEGAIYDFTLGLQREAFKAASGIGWPAKTSPPDVIVGDMDDLKARGWVYEPNEKATEYVRCLVTRTVIMATTGIKL